MKSALAPTASIAPRINAAGTSVLYALKPRGLGTPYVESLTGYWRRLAAAHVRRHAMLLEQLILAPHRASHPDDAGTFFPLSHVSPSLNGSLPMGAIILNHLEGLTGLRDVRRTTLHRVASSFILRRAFREFRAWCPECLEADGQAPYDRLLWSLTAFTVCPIHERKIIDACIKCGAQRRPLRADVREVECSACGASLTLRSRRATVDERTQLLVELIFWIESGKTITQQQVLNGVWHVYRKAGTYRAAKALGFPHSSIHRYVRTRKPYALCSFMNVVLGSGEDLQTFLSHETALPVVRRERPQPRTTAAQRSAVGGAQAVEEMRRQLARPEVIVSVRQFCKQQGISQPWLYRHHREMLRSFAVAGARNRAKRKALRVRTTHELIEREVRAVYAHHGRINWNLINDNLSVPGLLRNRAYSATAKRVLEELRKR